MKTKPVLWAEGAVNEAVERLGAAAKACNPDRAYDIGGQPLTGQDLQCVLDIVRQCEKDHGAVREQLLAALPDEWDTGEPGLADVADAVRHKLECRTKDCVRVLEALLPILRAHSLSKDEVEGDNLRAGDVAESAAGVLRWQQDRIEKLGDEVADARSDVASRSIVLPADWKAMLQQLVAGHSQTITDTRPKRRWWSRRQTGSAAALDIAGDVAALVEDWVTAAVSEAWEAGRG